MSAGVTVAAVVWLAVPLPAGGAASGHRMIVSRLAAARRPALFASCPLPRREAANVVGRPKQRHLRGLLSRFRWHLLLMPVPDRLRIAVDGTAEAVIFRTCPGRRARDPRPGTGG